MAQNDDVNPPLCTTCFLRLESDSSVKEFFHRFPPSQNSCKIRSQKSRGVLAKWTKLAIRPSSPPPISRLTRPAASRGQHYVGSGTTKVAQQALQNVRPTSRDPKVYAHSRLFERCRGSRTRRLCRRVAEYIPRASGGSQGCTRVHRQRSGRHPQRERYFTPTVALT
jgi:hypothetical protein